MDSSPKPAQTERPTLSLSAEVAHLARVDARIAQGGLVVTRLEALVRQHRAHGLRSPLGDDALSAARSAMMTLYQCRAMIMRTILDIQAGKYGRQD